MLLDTGHSPSRARACERVHTYRCHRCKQPTLNRSKYCRVCFKIMAHEKNEIEAARATGKRIEVDWDDCPLSDFYHSHGVMSLPRKRKHDIVTSSKINPSCHLHRLSADEKEEEKKRSERGDDEIVKIMRREEMRSSSSFKKREEMTKKRRRERKRHEEKMRREEKR